MSVRFFNNLFFLFKKVLYADHFKIWNSIRKKLKLLNLKHYKFKKPGVISYAFVYIYILYYSKYYV